MDVPMAKFHEMAEPTLVRPRLGLRMARVPVDYLPRTGVTKISFARDGLRIARRLATSRLVALTGALDADVQAAPQSALPREAAR